MSLSTIHMLHAAFGSGRSRTPDTRKYIEATLAGPLPIVRDILGSTCSSVERVGVNARAAVRGRPSSTALDRVLSKRDIISQIILVEPDYRVGIARQPVPARGAERPVAVALV